MEVIVINCVEIRIRVARLTSKYATGWIVRNAGASCVETRIRVARLTSRYATGELYVTQGSVVWKQESEWLVWIIGWMEIKNIWLNIAVGGNRNIFFWSMHICDIQVYVDLTEYLYICPCIYVTIHLSVNVHYCRIWENHRPVVTHWQSVRLEQDSDILTTKSYFWFYALHH
jgi:hypothetical protein